MHGVCKGICMVLTVCDLIACLKITLDGRSLRDLNVKWLRSQIGVVGQEPILFHETIAENIAFGSLEEVNRDQIIAAAKMANAHNFITQFPEVS